jgi:hypothetical protein
VNVSQLKVRSEKFDDDNDDDNNNNNNTNNNNNNNLWQDSPHPALSSHLATRYLNTLLVSSILSYSAATRPGRGAGHPPHVQPRLKKEYLLDLFYSKTYLFTF